MAFVAFWAALLPSPLGPVTTPLPRVIYVIISVVVEFLEISAHMAESSSESSLSVSAFERISRVRSCNVNLRYLIDFEMNTSLGRGTSDK